MNGRITASAPGKIHLLGEHSVVYGKPALIAAIDKRITVRLTPRNDSFIQVISKQYDILETKEIHKVLVQTKNAREQWNIFIKTKKVSDLVSITNGVSDYIFLAIGQSLTDFSSNIAIGAKQTFDKHPDSRNNNNMQGFTLDILSDIPVGSGCGSSSALAVTIAACIQKHVLETSDEKEILQTANRIEKFKHGTPSGGDPATVLHGGIIWFEKKNDEKIVRHLKDINKKIAKNFYLIDTGKPEETTGEMIAAVREFVDKNPKAGKNTFDHQEKLVREMKHVLITSDSTLMIRIIKAGEQNLERLGVVSDYTKKIIRDIENAGWAAKISGGGGITKGTGMLLVYCEDMNVIDRVCNDFDLRYYQTALGEEGLQIT